MIISDEQVRRAVEYLRTTESNDAGTAADALTAPKELVSRVVAQVVSLPDVREDRVEHARTLVAEELPPSDVLADKLIGRIVSDSLR